MAALRRGHRHTHSGAPSHIGASSKDSAALECNPSANRSLIAFAAWSSFAHGAVMAVLAFQIPSERGELLVAVTALVVIAVALIALAPAKQSVEQVSAAGG